MTATVSLLPPMTGAMLPPPSVPSLTDEEQRLVTGLASKLTFQAVTARLRWLYYDGEQRMQNLGISVPPVLAGVQCVVDWPRVCVDPLVPRCTVDGFRLAGATEVDDELQEFVAANDLSAELPLAFLDAFVAGRGYVIVGSPDVDGDAPLITVESPLNLAMVWDPRTRRATAAYQSYEVEGTYRAVLYTPQRTVTMSRDDGGSAGWVVENVDGHAFGEVPVVRLPNRSRTSDREGRSEITNAIMKTTDSACRTMLGMEIGREFYSVPHRYVLGAKESNFQDAQGNTKTAWDMAMNKFLALERDEMGNVPQVGQFSAFDPSVFTKIIDEGAQLMASYTGFPPDWFGQAGKANPASADAIRVSENGVVQRAKQAQRQFTGPLRQVMQLAWRFANDGAEPPVEVRMLDVDWQDAATATPAATSDAITKQIGVGSVPATSDVTLSRLGYSPLERRLLAQDRDAAQQLEAELTSSMAARQARAGNAIAKDLEAATVVPVVQQPAGE